MNVNIQRMTPLALRKKQPLGVWFILLMFLVIVVAVAISQTQNRFLEANTVLTVQDMTKCNKNFGHINYPVCLKYLRDNNLKDMSALWGGANYEQ